MNKRIPEPPKWAVSFLKAICPNYLFEEIEGDLLEKFNKDLKQFSLGRSKRRFVWNTVRFFRPGILLRKNFALQIMPLYMLVNYFKIAFRVMLRHKSFSLINISGLVIGITSAILLTLWIEREFSYDQFHPNKERLFKAYNKTVVDGQVQCWDFTPRVLAPTLAEEYTAVESAISFAFYGDDHLIVAVNNRLMKKSGIFTDAEFFSFFSFPLLKGNPEEALSNPNSIVINESLAKQLFAENEALGETIMIHQAGYSFPFTVSGILKDLPENTNFNFEYIIPFGFLETLEGKDTFWGNNSVSTYVKLKPGTDLASFNQEIRNIVSKYSNGAFTQEVFLYPFSRVHLYGQFENGVESGGRIEIIKMLGLLALSLVLIACINFVNLSTARAQKRSKEVGIRKVTGANRPSLIFQFLCESLAMALVAGVLSLLIAYMLLPWFNELIQQELTFQFENTTFWLLTASIVVLIGLIAGGYPAIYLSGFRPIRVLKGGYISFSSRNIFRRILVVFQFGFAVMLIFSTVVIHRQIRHVQERDAGYERNNLIYHSLTGDLMENYSAYKTELLNSGLVSSVTKTYSPITEGWTSTWDIKWEGKDEESKVIIDRFYVDDKITETAGIKLVLGRDMDLEKYPSDSTAVLLNEAAVKLMGFKDPIGEVIKDGETDWHVIGVIKDFILNSPYGKVRPMVLQGSKGMFNTIHIKLNEHNFVPDNLADIREIFNRHNPDYPFNYFFVDEVYNRKFAGIEKTLTITSLFSTIIIFIACLGLFGLSIYVIEGKLKEIGVRKVLGGSVLNIVKLLCINALKPILIAILIFSPMAWIAMTWYLQFYEYRINPDLTTLVLASLVLIIIAVITISSQTIKAALTNPVNTLRSE